MLIKRNFILSILLTLLFIALSWTYYMHKNMQYNVDGFLHKATHYFKSENYIQAIRYYKKLILMGVKDEKVYTNIAISLIRIGYYQEAVDYLLEIEEDNVSPSEIYYLLAYSYYSKIKLIDKKNDFKIPIQYLEKSIELDSRNKISYKLLGKIYEETNKFEHARTWYRKALFEDIDNSSEFYGLIANTYFKGKKFDEAIKYYNKAIKSNKNYISAYYNMAEIYKIQQNFDKAEQNYKEIIKISPDYVYPYYQIGNLYFNKAEYENAIEWYKKALELEPNEQNVNYYIGLSYKKINNLKKTIEHLKLSAYCGNDDAVKELRTMLETF